MVFANFQNMDKLEDLLPGIEEYICEVLAGEPLSTEAEEQRLYFVERLDIVKLPPSIPPRPKNIVIEPVQLYPIQDKFHTADPTPSYEQEDFAAHQREISRALVTSNSGSVASLDVSDTKVYDDIEPKDVRVKEGDGSHIDEDESMYEIPQINRMLSDSGYEKAISMSNVSKPDSAEDNSNPAILGPTSPVPPPLPPRGERNMSDSASRASIGSLLEDKLQDATSKVNLLSRDFSITSQPEKRHSRASEKSSDDMLSEYTDQCDGASVNSLDASSCQDSNGNNFKKPGIRLPKPVHKKKKRHRKVGQSLSSSLWEVSQPLCALDDITLSGDLHYRSTLSWTKKLVALTNGRLVCYKRDKIESRPTFVILLNGYQATFQKRDGRRGFEILLCHDNLESHLFLADFKEWAQIWCEHINCAAEGRRAHGGVQHLARGTIIDTIGDSCRSLSKTGLRSSASNISTASSDGFDSEPGTVKVKKIDESGVKTARMGTFAYKATQFFESFGKKSSKKAPFSERGFQASDPFRIRSSSAGAMLKKTPLFEAPRSPISPECEILESPQELEVTRHVKCQGFLDVYSSFNKRRWGKRWCMVQDNSFECYRTQTSDVCELEFLLHTCILRRAIEETKSQLGLMLMESNREKITVEPTNWDEMGAWLPVLMKETATPAIPEGLEAFMVDTHPYHEATETCRLSDPFPNSPQASIPSPDRNSTSKNGDCKDRQNNSRWQNCDSGNYSAESIDGYIKTGSHDHHTTEVHPNYSDSSLPRVDVNDSGDLYTKIRKTSVTASPVTDRSTIPTCSITTDEISNSEFENCESSSSFQLDESMVDEVLSRFSSQISGGFLLDDEFQLEDSTNQNDVISGVDVCNVSNEMCDSETRTDVLKSKSVNLQELDSIISPIKGISNRDKSPEVTVDSFLCSSFAEGSDNENKCEIGHGKADNPGPGITEGISADVSHCDENLNIMDTTESNTSNSVIDNYSNNSGLENDVDIENNIIIGNLDNEVKHIEMHTPVTTEGITNLTRESVVADSHGTDCGKVARLDQSATGIIIDNCDIVKNSDDVTIDDIARNNILNVDVLHSDHVTNGNHSTNGDIVIRNHVTNPDVDVTNLDVDVTNPDVDVTNPDVDVTNPDVDVTNPDVDVTNPDLAANGNHVVNDSVSVREHAGSVRRKQSSAMLRELGGKELHATMEELRIKLVQLKKDRISIRDRKQQTSSETDQEFLDAEFDRLNRECTKVTDEISYLESLRLPDANEEKSGKIEHH